MGKKIIVVQIQWFVISLFYVFRKEGVKCITPKKFLFVCLFLSVYKTVYTHGKNLETTAQKN